MEIWKPFGKLQVGIADVEYSNNNQNVDPYNVDPKNHLSGRLYYPCTGHRPVYQVLRRGTAWLPNFTYAYGLAQFLFFRRPKGALYTVAKYCITAVSYALGKLQLMDFFEGAPLNDTVKNIQLPVVVFSHGLGGHRGVYAIICSELASQGYIVLALEHADGTSSAARLAGGKFRFYRGLGNEEQQVEKTRHRIEEMKTARKVLLAMHRGDDLPGLKLSHGLDASQFLKGMLDFRCLAALGHSYGGATVSGLISEDPLYRCAVAYDPWWYALPPENSALEQWKTRAPLLILGSHDWNVPNAFGELMCGEERQEKVLHAAKVQKPEEGSLSAPGTGGGALLLIINGSSHNTYADPLALFSEHVGWVLRMLGLTARLDPVLGIHMVNTSTLNFLSRHLPLTEEQRALQTWAPSKGHTALDRIKQQTEADMITHGGSGRKGLLSWMFPDGRGVLNAASDYLMDKFLMLGRRPQKAQEKDEESKEKKGESNGNGHHQLQPPSDVFTEEEMLESTMPSADPASGQHPHAPSMTVADHMKASGGADADEQGHQEEDDEKARLLRGVKRLEEEEKAAIRAAIGQSHSGALSEDDVKDYLALLGEEHIYKMACSV